ncbi:MAG: hypothetical protein Q4F88_03960 [Eubacteriales bacterium]|nr:hypothetical protein [Eubacteriales bacterium]
MRKHSRRKKRSLLANIFIILISICIIIISVFVIKSIISQVTKIKLRADVNFGETTATSIAITSKKEPILIEDSNGIKYKKEDDTYLIDDWVEIDNSLYKFNQEGYAINGEIKDQGQVLIFDKGKLTKIIKDNTYKESSVEYFSEAYSDEYKVYLSKEEMVDTYYPIKYKRISSTNELNDTTTEYYLGGEDNKQYSSEYLVQIESNYIYFLCMGEDKSFCGKVNKMRMNATLKETFGTNVEGYIAINGRVWYYENGAIHRGVNGEKEEVLPYQKLEDMKETLETTNLYVPGIDEKNVQEISPVLPTVDTPIQKAFEPQIIEGPPRR